MHSHERAARRVNYEIEVTLESDHNFYTGMTRDLSEGGVFVATYDPPAVGTIVELGLTLPGVENVFRMMGVVRWRRDIDIAITSEGLPTGCGIEWVDISYGALKAIQDFVRVRDTLFFEAA